MRAGSFVHARVRLLTGSIQMNVERVKPEGFYAKPAGRRFSVGRQPTNTVRIRATRGETGRKTERRPLDQSAFLIFERRGVELSGHFVASVEESPAVQR